MTEYALKKQRFTNIIARFFETGDLTRIVKDLKRTVTYEKNKLNVSLAVTNAGHKSQRDLCKFTGISGRSVQRMWKKNRFHA